MRSLLEGRYIYYYYWNEWLNEGTRCEWQTRDRNFVIVSVRQWIVSEQIKRRVTMCFPIFEYFMFRFLHELWPKQNWFIVYMHILHFEMRGSFGNASFPGKYIVLIILVPLVGFDYFFSFSISNAIQSMQLNTFYSI